MTETAPVVSVVIPVYNSMPYLTGTVESLLAQELAALEIIAIDDGSTDGSGAELDRFAELDDRVTVVHQANSGWPGMPRNRGLERARGTYVLFMDADDTMAPEALRLMVAQADEHDADVVIPRFEGTGGRQVQALFERHPEGPIELARAMETLSPQKLFRRAMLERIGLRFPEGRVRLEDGIFVTRAYIEARRIMFCGAGPLYFIALRDDGGNISGQRIDPENYVASCRRIAETLLEGTPDREAAVALVRQFFGRKGLRFYAPKRWLRMDDAQRARWVALHRDFLHDLLPPEADARIAHPTDRRKVELIRAGDLAGLDALIRAAELLEHTGVVTGTRAVPGGIELTVAVHAAHENAPSRRAGAWLRVRLADRVYRLLRPVITRRTVRGASRVAADLLLRDRPRATLLLSGRKRGRAAAVPGRLAPPAPATGDAPRDAAAPRYRFVLPHDLLRRYRGERVDAWTVLYADRATSGDRARLTAQPGLDRRVDGVRVYATNRGNCSLQVRSTQ
ncbi:glycosyltransferase family 2 protein [Leucobacter chromiiresistens]|uniref:Cell wall biosynthesis glycosyltransferase n=1 Tax=Leucobacter chromiiresistens TaxID=1079994 RepID=A0A147EQM0_9MICO|nr:glycosyltransferase family 2 protein [Leucobacter chromiiresistens]KTR86665.1 cell wall biosynthesis glycosyltransferase [Leucobacter chromiiresistens]